MWRSKPLLIALAAIALAASVPAAQGDEKQGDEKEEISRSIDLGPGGRVEIRSINGPVKVETWNQARAEIRVTKSSRYGVEELQKLQVSIEQSGNRLVVSTRKTDENGDARVKVQVEAKLPRQIALDISGVNGSVGIGAIEGRVEVDGVNGRFSLEAAAELNVDGINGSLDVGPVGGAVEIDGVNGPIAIKEARELNVSGVNGAIQATFNNLGAGGVEIEGVNGTIKLGLPDGADAKIDVTNLRSGSVRSTLPLSAISQTDPREFHAMLGSGGTPIRIDGVNGNIYLEKAAAVDSKRSSVIRRR